jgi:hypothetical protein
LCSKHALSVAKAQGLKTLLQALVVFDVMDPDMESIIRSRRFGGDWALTLNFGLFECDCWSLV